MSRENLSQWKQHAIRAAVKIAVCPECTPEHRALTDQESAEAFYVILCSTHRLMSKSQLPQQ